MLKKLRFLLFLAPVTPLFAQFTPLCTGTSNGFVVSFENFQGQVYATGFFNTICGDNTGHIARWNGQDWETAAKGGIDDGHALKVINDQLYIASYESGTDSNYVLRWDGSVLDTLGTVYRSNPNPNQSLTSSIYDIIEYQGDIVISGEFNRVAGKAISGIARWNGLQWDTLGAGLSGSITSSPPIMYPHQMAIFEDDLVVCGNFLKAGGQTVKGIARWNGQQWQAFGPGFNGPVYGMGVFNGVLYAGGEFTASGSTSLGGIARWNGTAWENPGFNFKYSIAGLKAFVHTIRQIGDSLYITGGFNRITLASGATQNASGVVSLNADMQLNTLGGGIPNIEIEAIIPFGNTVLVGGGANNGDGYTGIWNPAASAVQSPASEAAIQLFPNPASDRIEIAGLHNFDYKTMIINDMSGNIRYQTAAPPNEDVFRLPPLPAGIYVMRLEGSAQDFPVARKLTIAPQ